MDQKSDAWQCDKTPIAAPSRRNFLKLAGTAAITAGLTGPLDSRALASGASASGAGEHRSVDAPAVPPRGYNILFIVTDQERHFDAWPFPVPGREALRQRGITFKHHQIASCVCSPSRSTIYTGQHIQHTGVFDNAGSPWQPDLSPDIRTVGHMLQDIGYHTAYLGKWHLSRSMRETLSPYNAPVGKYNQIMKRYGFDDYFGVGDLITGPRGGYNYDGLTTESAVSWLRDRASELKRANKPWFLAVNLVNPHDVMFTDTDPVGVNLQRSKPLMIGNRRPPDENLYLKTWTQVPLSPSRHQPYNAPGRPPAQGMYVWAHGNLVGRFPFTDERIRVYQDYYFNCMRDCDAHVERLLHALESLELDNDTIIVFTSDHGDHVGAHQMVGKGTSAYREQNHVPLIICHPAYPGGKTCGALTSHVDITPTLIGLAGADEATIAKVSRGKAVGHNIAKLLDRPEAANTNAIRDTSLFNYSMLLYYDSEWMLKEWETWREKGVSEEVIQRQASALRPDFRLRGAIRSVFDGRYRFSRYFSLTNFNQPTTLEALFANNDIELFDLQADPGEINNLALQRETHADLLMAMTEKLNKVIEREVGEDSPRYMPIRNGQIQINFHSPIPARPSGA